MPLICIKKLLMAYKNIDNFMWNFIFLQFICESSEIWREWNFNSQENGNFKGVSDLLSQLQCLVVKLKSF